MKIKTDLVSSHYRFERREPQNIKHVPWAEEERASQKRDLVYAIAGILFFIAAISIPLWK